MRLLCRWFRRLKGYIKYVDYTVAAIPQYKFFCEINHAWNGSGSKLLSKGELDCSTMTNFSA